MPCVPSDVSVKQVCEGEGVVVTWAPSLVATLYELTAIDGQGNVFNCTNTESTCTFTDLHCGQDYGLTITATGDNCTSMPSLSTFTTGTILMQKIPFVALLFLHSWKSGVSGVVKVGVCKRVFQWWKCGLFKCSSTGIILWHNLFYSTVSTYWFNGVLQLWEHICHPLMESKRGRCELPCRCPTYKWWPALLWILYSYLHLWRPGVWWNVHFLRWILQWNLQQLIKWISGGRSR